MAVCREERCHDNLGDMDGINEEGKPSESLNHYSYGAITGWLIGGVCGIQQEGRKINNKNQSHARNYRMQRQCMILRLEQLRADGNTKVIRLRSSLLFVKRIQLI